MNVLVKVCFLAILPACALSTLHAQDNTGESVPARHEDGGFRNTDPKL